MRKFSFCLIILSFLMTGFGVSAAEIRANIQSSQKQGEEREKDVCYQSVKSMKDAGFAKSEETLPKDPKTPDDQDAQYSIYKSSGGSTCIVLENNGANDLAWGLGAHRHLGCSCSLVLEIK